MYAEDIAETIAALLRNHHLYADDTQLQKNLHKSTLWSIILFVSNNANISNAIMMDIAQ